MLQGSESVSPFHLFHPFIDWSKLVASLVPVCLLGFWFGVVPLLSHVADQSLRSSCLPMTTLAQLMTATVVMTSAALIKKNSYIASSMCAMTRQTQLHSIQHVCKDKTNTVA